MKTQKLLGYELVEVCSSFKTNKSENGRNELSEETKRTLTAIVDRFLLDISLETSKLTLFHLVNNNRSITMDLFSQNIEEYISLRVAQSVTSSFNEGLENVICQFSKVLIKAQGGQVFENPEPFDLKFKLNGEEYVMDIKPTNEQNSYNIQTLEEHISRAEKAEIKYRLCLYDFNHQTDESYILNGEDFWKLISGIENAKTLLFKLINGAANRLSISSIIRETKFRFINEWRMKD